MYPPSATRFFSSPLPAAPEVARVRGQKDVHLSLLTLSLSHTHSLSPLSGILTSGSENGCEYPDQVSIGGEAHRLEGVKTAASAGHCRASCHRGTRNWYTKQNTKRTVPPTKTSNHSDTRSLFVSSPEPCRLRIFVFPYSSFNLLSSGDSRGHLSFIGSHMMIYCQKLKACASF